MKNEAISSSDIGNKDIELEYDSSNTAGGSWLINLYQKFMKSTIGEKALATLGMPTEESEKQNAPVIGGAGRISSAAGEQEHTTNLISDQKVDKEHTIVVVSDKKSEEIVHAPKAEENVSATCNTCPIGHVIEPSDEQSKNTLVIKNLPFKFKPTDLENLLTDNQANPKNVRMLRDEAGRFTGMAFIRCPSKEEAQRLILAMDGMDIGGRNIQVEFKMKKKKRSKLASSTDSASSLSSDEMSGIPVNRLRTSGDHHSMGETQFKRSDVGVQASANPIIVSNSNQQNYPQRPVRKLAVSAENMSARTSSNSSDDKFKKPPQIRRKSTSAFDTAPSSFYSHSVVPRVNQFASGPSIRPVRQPVGPDGKSNGFSDEYRRARTARR